MSVVDRLPCIAEELDLALVLLQPAAGLSLGSVLQRLDHDGFAVAFDAGQSGDPGVDADQVGNDPVSGQCLLVEPLQVPGDHGRAQDPAGVDGHGGSCVQGALDRPVLGGRLVPQPLRRGQALGPGALPQGRHLAIPPAGLHLGLARYAEEHGSVYARIDAIDEGRDKTLRSLDLKDPQVRAAILAAEKDGKSAADLFNGTLARNRRRHGGHSHDRWQRVAGDGSVRTLFEPLEVECGVRCDVGVAGVDGLLVGSPGCVRVPLRRPVSRSP